MPAEPARLTRRDRRQAAQRLSELADEAAQIGSWLDALGDDQLADRAARITECATRDMHAAAWLLFDADRAVPEGWLNVTANGRPQAP